MKGLGYGKGYQYAHDVEEKVANAVSARQLRGRVYYHPTNEGVEKRIANDWKIKRIKSSHSAKKLRKFLASSRLGSCRLVSVCL